MIVRLSRAPSSLPRRCLNALGISRPSVRAHHDKSAIRLRKNIEQAVEHLRQNVVNTVARLRFCVISTNALSFVSGLTASRIASRLLATSILHMTVLLWPG